MLGLSILNGGRSGPGSVASISPAPRRAPVNAARDTLSVSMPQGSHRCSKLHNVPKIQCDSIGSCHALMSYLLQRKARARLVPRDVSQTL